MGVDAKTRQRQLWDILGKPEKKQFAFDPILTGKRIGAGRGEYWYGRGGAAAGGGKDGDGKGDEDSKDKEGEDGKNGGGNQSNNVDDPRRDPAKGCPKPGDTVPGLKNLRDCTRAVYQCGLYPAAETARGLERQLRAAEERRPCRLGERGLLDGKLYQNLLHGRAGGTGGTQFQNQARSRAVACCQYNARFIRLGGAGIRIWQLQDGGQFGDGQLGGVSARIQ